MAVPRDPVQAAERVNTELQAARLNEDLEAELALGDRSGDWNGQAERARALLAERWGGFDALHNVDTAKRTAGYLDRSGRRHGGRRRAASAKPSGKPAGRSQPAKPAPRTTRPSRRSPTGRGGRVARRAFQQTGIPSATGSTAAFALNVLGLMLGLALLYLVLTSAERGRSVLGAALTSLTGGIRAFVAPHDPLAPHTQPVPSTSDLKRAFGGQDFASFPSTRTATRTTTTGVTTP